MVSSVSPAAGLKSGQFDRKLKLHWKLDNLIMVI
jgi:hypothetical protein